MADYDGLDNVSFDDLDGWPSFLPSQLARDTTEAPSSRPSPELSVTSDVTSDVEQAGYGHGQSRSNHARATLPLLQLADWNKHEAYDERPPSCIYYSIEWRITFYGKLFPKDTEPDVVLAPGAFDEGCCGFKITRCIDNSVCVFCRTHKPESCAQGST
jgi:hypothetical protein